MDLDGDFPDRFVTAAYTTNVLVGGTDRDLPAELLLVCTVLIYGHYEYWVGCSVDDYAIETLRRWVAESSAWRGWGHERVMAVKKSIISQGYLHFLKVYAAHVSEV